MPAEIVERDLKMETKVSQGETRSADGVLVRNENMKESQPKMYISIEAGVALYK